MTMLPRLRGKTEAWQECRAFVFAKMSKLKF